MRVTIPAPTGGWNTRDDVAAMPVNDAEALDNWLPELTYLRPRPGFFERTTTSVGSAIKSLHGYSGGEKKALFACTDTEIWDVSDRYVVLLKEDGLGSGDWQSVNFEGQLVLVNGVDRPRVWDGSSFDDPDYVIGLPARMLCGVHAFKNRLYYIANNRLDFFYTELYAHAGTLTRFRLAPECLYGGRLLAITSWTVDGGDGVDDYLVCITDQGEVIVYQGTDPGKDFQQVGRYKIGRPVSRRAVTQYMGKVYIATDQDYLTLPDALYTQGVVRNTKLSGAARDAAAEYSGNPGWQAFYDPTEGLLLMNVPTKEQTAVQHVLNLRTGAATRFTGINTQSWVKWNGATLFGGYDGKVYRYGRKHDNKSNIKALAKTAPSVLGIDAEKRISAYRLRVSSDGDLTFTSGLSFDFEKPDSFNTHTFSGYESVAWGAAWGSDWPTRKNLRTEWIVGEGRGSFVALELRLNFRYRDIRWFTTEYQVDVGSDFR